MSEFTYNDELHEYKLNGLKIPSVTQVIEDVFPMSEFIPKELLKQKADLGKKIHSTTELYDKGTLDEKSLHSILQNYLNQWIKFRKDYNVQFNLELLSENIELMAYHSVYKFAGRIDRTCLVSKEKSIIDIKSGTEQKTHQLQTAAYSMLVNQLLDKKLQIKKRYAVYLSETDYKVKPHTNTNDENIFLSCLSIYNYKRRK